MKAPVLVWFRQDLRLADNPALTAAAETGRPLVPVYVFDLHSGGDRALGAASRWWLHHSLSSLSASLSDRLLVMAGKPLRIITELAAETGATAVYWNRCYEPWRVRDDRTLQSALRKSGIVAEGFDGTVLFPPQSISKGDGTPYRVFTPYFRNGCLKSAPAPRQPLPVPLFQTILPDVSRSSIESLKLIPRVRWYDEIESTWNPGEHGATMRLEEFLDDGVQNYKSGRDRPDQNHVSRLSPHLHFGELSPNTAWYAVAASTATHEHVEHFQSELGWREFSRYLLYHFPELPWQNFQPKFDRFPWRNDSAAVACWQRGQTGYPIVDAGMRELWRTGYMHNRVRMIAASFLVKNLMVHWHYGEQWFRDTLVDADVANNAASWQWVAGSGADAAPYFRIFNPVSQGRKFDPDGTYVRRYVPELRALPPRMIHSPWEHNASELREHGVRLGRTYPEPIVDLSISRERALEAFRSLGGDRNR